MKTFFILSFILTSIFSKDLVDINFSNLKLNDLVKITSEKIGINILVTNKLEGNVEFISSKPVKKIDLLNILKDSLEDNGYILIENNSILKIAKKDKLSKRDFFTKVVSLENIDATNAKKMLDNIISKRFYKKNDTPSVSYLQESNSLIIDGKKDDVDNLINVIKDFDLVKTQVFVKAMIVEVDNTMVENIGLKYGIFKGSSKGGNINTFASNLNGGNAISIDTSSIGLNIPNVTSALALGATLNLLNQTSALEVVSEPSILSLNNQSSKIYVGQTVSVQTGSTVSNSGSIVNVLKRENIGLTLKVKPRVIKNSRVILDINTVFEGVKSFEAQTNNPTTSKKELQTTAIVNNGETVIIGGLIEKKDEDSVQKIPIASDIPLFGELFKNRENITNKKNLVVIVTPYIVPKNKDLTYIRDELSKLKILE